MKTSTNTLFSLHPSQLPKHKTPSYIRICANIRPHKEELRQVRWTVGGDRIKYSGKLITPTAELTTVKSIANSNISTPNACWMTMDIKHFYLETPISECKYVFIPVKHVPGSIMKQYQFREKDLIHNGFVVSEICQGVYGLTQAVILAKKRLVKYLSKYDYIPAKHTPVLLIHPTRPATFVLTVYYFSVKYVGKEHDDHLVNAIQDLYTCTTDWNGTLYCGINFKWYHHNCTVCLSMPGYIA